MWVNAYVRKGGRGHFLFSPPKSGLPGLRKGIHLENIQRGPQKFSRTAQPILLNIFIPLRQRVLCINAGTVLVMWAAHHEQASYRLLAQDITCIARSCYQATYSLALEKLSVLLTTPRRVGWRRVPGLVPDRGVYLAPSPRAHDRDRTRHDVGLPVCENAVTNMLVEMLKSLYTPR